MAYKRCVTCHGSGKIMGGGMIFNDCEVCDGRGKYNIDKVEVKELPPVKIDKRSKHYRNAIKKIKALDPKMNSKTAQQIFEDELTRLDKDVANDSRVRAT